MAMSQVGPPPKARPLFRKLAFGVAVFCFIAAAVFGVAAPEEGWFGPGVLLFNGFIMAAIGATGNLPGNAR